MSAPASPGQRSVRQSSLLTGVLCVAQLASLAGCFVRGESEPASVTIALELGGSAKGGPPPPDGVVDLDRSPCYVGVTISAPDLPAASSAAWVCDPGEDPGGEVELSLEVTAGLGRQLEVVAFLRDASGLRTYASYSEQDLAGGDVDLDLTLQAVGEGSLDALIHHAGADVEAVQLVDVQTGVRLPSLSVTPAGSAFHFSVDWLAAGRFYRLLISLADGRVLDVSECPIHVRVGSVTALDIDAASGGC